MMLAAKAMGYDSSPMIGFDIEKVAELISLPDDYVMGAMLASWQEDQEDQGGLAQARPASARFASNQNFSELIDMLNHPGHR
jgi:nitroreductase